MFNEFTDGEGFVVSLCEVVEERNVNYDMLIDKYTYHNQAGLVEIDTPVRPKKGDFIWHNDGMFRLLERSFVMNNFKKVA